MRGLARALYSLHTGKDATTPTLTHGLQVGLSHSATRPSTAITDPRWQRRLDEPGLLRERCFRPDAPSLSGRRGRCP